MHKIYYVIGAHQAEVVSCAWWKGFTTEERALNYYNENCMHVTPIQVSYVPDEVYNTIKDAEDHNYIYQFNLG